jgi:glycosyltransferase involved in cell wall biosynthesis
VNRTWLANPSFPKLGLYWYEPTARPIPGPNVHIERGFLTERVIHEQQNKCGIHLCPSEAEGYGHYLAEAMSCGAVVVSTDAPPMNELITNDRGVLVGYARQAPQAVGTNFYVDELKLAQAMQEIFAMPLEERKRLGEAARAWFLENDRAFRARFWEVLQGLA